MFNALFFLFAGKVSVHNNCAHMQADNIRSNLANNTSQHPAGCIIITALNKLFKQQHLYIGSKANRQKENADAESISILLLLCFCAL